MEIRKEIGLPLQSIFLYHACQLDQERVGLFAEPEPIETRPKLDPDINCFAIELATDGLRDLLFVVAVTRSL